MRPAAKILTGIVLIAAMMSTAQNVRAAGELEAQARSLDAVAASRNATAISERIAAQYTQFAGSSANAVSLVKGLRAGKVVTLRSRSGEGADELVAFNASNGPLEWGDVHSALAVAQARLARMGIKQAGPKQIQATLLGGALLDAEGSRHEVEGVLQQRHMGVVWDRIAQSSGARPLAIANTLVRSQDRIAQLPIEHRVVPVMSAAETHFAPAGASANAEPGAPVYSMPVTMTAMLSERAPSAWGRYVPQEKPTRGFENLPGIR